MADILQKEYRSKRAVVGYDLDIWGVKINNIIGSQEDDINEVIVKVNEMKGIDGKTDRGGYTGTSQDIVNKIGNKYTFDKASDISLVAGNIIETLGYYTKGDGGGFKAKINTIPSTYPWDYISSDGWYNVKWFGAKGNGANFDDAFINEALSRYSNVYFSKGDFLIRDTLVVPTLTSVKGLMNSSRIISNFTTGVWIGSEKITIRLACKDGINQYGLDFNKTINGLSFSTIGASTTIATCIMIRSERPNDIGSGTTVNFALYDTHINQLYIEKYDCAIDIRELWGTDFSGIMVNECREGIKINGQVVNINFNFLQFTNFTNANTTITANTIGMSFYNSDRYNGNLKNPEGITVCQSTIFGAKNNFVMRDGLAIKVNGCIIDGGVEETFLISGVQDLTINDNYIYTSYTRSILLRGISVVQDGTINITNNNFVGDSVTVTGVYFENIGVSREKVTVDNNMFFNIKTGVLATMCPNYSFITNNKQTGKGYSFVDGQAFVNILNNGKDTIVDNNISDSSIAILRCHPTLTSNRLRIGQNSSDTMKTRSRGIATILAGQTSVISNFGFGSSDQYIRPIVALVPTQAIFVYFSPEIVWMNGTFNISAPIATNLRIMYDVSCIPYSAY